MLYFQPHPVELNTEHKVFRAATYLLYDQTKEYVSKLRVMQGYVCVFASETGKLKAEKEHQFVPVHATSLVPLVVPGFVC